MSAGDDNPPLSGGALASGALLGGWIVLCDVWVKVLARSAGCEPIRTVTAAVSELWSSPQSCPGLEVGPVALSPQTRPGIGPIEAALPPGTEPLWGLALFALATVLSILVLRWRWRIPGDALALGCLWSAVLIHGLPRLMAGGTTFTELQVAGLGLSLGDLAMLFALPWLAWRFIAELTA